MASTMSFAQDFLLISDSGTEIILGHQLTEKPFETIEIDGLPFVSFDKTHKITMKEAGSPSLPVFSESVIIPNEGDASISIEHDGYVEYTNIDIAPSKGSLKRNINPTDVPYNFGDVYSIDAFYPSSIANLTEPFIFRNVRGATVQFSPYQYNPVSKTLRVYQNIRAHIVTDNHITGENELIITTPSANDPFNRYYSSLFANAVTEKYTPVEEDGEMLIIAADSYTDEMEPYVLWKNQSGIKTTMVNMTTIGANVDTDIKNYITDFYATHPELVYVLLVGDHNTVKSHTYGNSGGEQLWSDSYYGQLSGGTNDYYPELFIGRFSANTTSQLTTQINRAMEYEKNPAAGTWMSKAIGLASDEGAGIGDDGEPDWQHARNNRTKLLNYGYTEVYEFYDGSHGGADASGNPNAAMILPAVNGGVGLFNYTGHGDQTTCVTGNFGSGDINSATNNGYYPFVISVACNNGTFTSGTCISESWAWASNGGNPTGAIAACGSTILMAWAEPMQTQDEMTDIITEAYANNKKETLGGLFYNSQMSMLEQYGSSATAKEVMQTWVMFGDPSVMFRNKATLDMVVTHVGNVPLGTTSVAVNCDVEDARVTIVQNGEIIGKATVSGGVANVTFAALVSNMPLTVTAVKQNYKPYQGTITVADGPASLNEVLFESLRIYPNPVENILNISWDNELAIKSIEIYDLKGQLVYSTASSIANQHQIDVNSFAKGVYTIVTSTEETSKVNKIVVQ